MAFSRHSLRRVLGDMVHRHSPKTEPTHSSSLEQLQKTYDRSRKKSDRNSIISNDSLNVCIEFIDELNAQLYLFD